jgi:hypothetical protein
VTASDRLTFGSVELIFSRAHGRRKGEKALKVYHYQIAGTTSQAIDMHAKPSRFKDEIKPMEKARERCWRSIRLHSTTPKRLIRQRLLSAQLKTSESLRKITANNP